MRMVTAISTFVVTDGAFGCATPLPIWERGLWKSKLGEAPYLLVPAASRLFINYALDEMYITGMRTGGVLRLQDYHLQ